MWDCVSGVCGVLVDPLYSSPPQSTQIYISSLLDFGFSFMHSAQDLFVTLPRSFQIPTRGFTRSLPHGVFARLRPLHISRRSTLVRELGGILRIFGKFSAGV